MNKRFRILLAVSVCTVVLSVVGALSVMADYGASDDPLVTKSYIDSVLTPEVTAKIDAEITKNVNEMQGYVTDKLGAHMSVVEQKIAQLGGGAALQVDQTLVNRIAEQVIAQLKSDVTAATPTWQVVSIPDGKTLTAKVGTEFILRIGSANCYSSSSGGIVNLTAGSELAPGNALLANNLYLVSVSDRGLKGVSGCTIVISGQYSIN